MTELVIDAKWWSGLRYCDKYRYREFGRSLTFGWRIYDREVEWDSVMPHIIIIN